MNNFTKTESLPKAGHVNEVCKEWLVREDGALAYKLQSQEINEFYKGNRFRNAVVREDFPTALHEQIKEHEHAEKQTEAYRRRLYEQEEHDKRVAKEIADKLERDLQEQQQKDYNESEMIAQKMQEIYVNLPPVPPPTAGRNKAKAPPRPQKASTLQQHQHQSQLNTNDLSSPTTTTTIAQSLSQPQPQTSTTSSHSSPTSSMGSTRYPYAGDHHSPPEPLSFTSNTDGYVGLCLAPGTLDPQLMATPQRARQAQSAQASCNLLVSDESPSPTASSAAVAFNQFMERSKVGRSAVLLNNNHFIADSQQQQQHQQQQPQLTTHHNHHNHQHSASNASAGSSASGSSSSHTRRNVFEFINQNQTQSTTPQTPTPTPNPTTTTTPTAMHSHSHPFLHTPPLLPPAATSSASFQAVEAVEELIEYSDVADSVRRRGYDRTPTAAGADALDASSSAAVMSTSTSNHYHHQHHNNHHQRTPTQSASHHFTPLRSPSNENLLKTDEHFQKLSPEKYDQMMGNDAVGGILSGAAAERHMQQHADDIELYVDPCDYASLREIGLPMHEIKEMSKKIKQEQKDELLARRLQQQESHDGMTQEQRDRLMAIEAQDKELAKMLQEREKAKAKRAKEKARLRKSQQKDGTTSSSSSSNGLHCGPLMSLPQDCMSAAKHLTQTASKHAGGGNRMHSPLQDDHPDLEAYSNPIDILHNQQRMLQNGTLTTNGTLLNESTGDSRHNSISSVSAGQGRDDDIYTLPVDSCRPGARPASLNIGSDSAPQHQNNSMTRSENYSLESQHELQSVHEILPRLNYSKSSSFDPNSSPTPPYMPIQGTRRSHLGEDRKKKNKDKCTHQ